MKCDLYLMLYHQKLYYLYCVFLMNVHRYITKCLCCIHVGGYDQTKVCFLVLVLILSVNILTCDFSP